MGSNPLYLDDPQVRMQYLFPFRPKCKVCGIEYYGSHSVDEENYICRHCRAKMYKEDWNRDNL